MRVLLFFVVAIPVAFFAMLIAASELGGEVVELRTVDPSGATQETSLWIVDKDGHSYLRAGDATTASWYANLERNPEVEVERGGVVGRYRAVPMAQLTSQIDALIARDYGLADRLIALQRDPSKSVAIRLVPID